MDIAILGVAHHEAAHAVLAARATVIHAIDASFVTGFRVAMFVAAGLALAGGLVAALMVESTATSAARHVPEQRLTWTRLTVVDSADVRRR